MPFVLGARTLLVGATQSSQSFGKWVPCDGLWEWLGGARASGARPDQESVSLSPEADSYTEIQKML